MIASVRRLLALPRDQVAFTQIIAFDWQDGPVEGFLTMADLDFHAYFQKVAERTDSDAPDDRIYLLFEAPKDAIDRLTEVLRTCEPPKSPMWIPRWSFDDAQQRQQADDVVAELMRQVDKPLLLLRSVDLIDVSEVWAYTGRATIAP